MYKYHAHEKQMVKLMIYVKLDISVSNREKYMIHALVEISTC